MIKTTDIKMAKFFKLGDPAVMALYAAFALSCLILSVTGIENNILGAVCGVLFCLYVYLAVAKASEISGSKKVTVGLERPNGAWHPKGSNMTAILEHLTTALGHYSYIEKSEDNERALHELRLGIKELQLLTGVSENEV